MTAESQSIDETRPAQVLRVRHVGPSFRTYAGSDALNDLPRELMRSGATRVVIVCGRTVADNRDVMDRLNEVLGDRFAGLFDGVSAHSPLPSVEEASAFLADHGADGVIAVGGGSAVVTSRAASILLAEGKPIRELATRRESGGSLISPRLNAPKLPQWVVATTPTTAYAKAGSAVRDPETGDRLALFDPKTRAQGVFIDPVAALSAPVALVTSAALNVYATAIEGLQSKSVDPLADALLRHAVKIAVEWLPLIDDAVTSAEARMQLMLAALLAGQGSDFTGGGLAQALSHAIGPRSAVANGVVEALLLPHTTRFNEDAVRGRVADLADLLGVSRHDPAALTVELERLSQLFGVPARLRDAGVSVGDIDEAVTHTLDDWAITNVPRSPTIEELSQLVRRAW